MAVDDGKGNQVVRSAHATGEPTTGEAAGPRRCRNCGAVLGGPWCAQCGQRARDLERPVRALVAEFVENVLSLDGRAARTVDLLFFHPGALTRRYLAGQRVRFVPPLRLLLISLVLFFLALEIGDVALVQFRIRSDSGAGIVSFGAGARNRDLDLLFLAPLARDADASGAELTAEMAAVEREARKSRAGTARAEAGIALARRLIAGFEHALRDPGPLNRFLHDWVPRVLFLLIPVFALLLRLFFGRARRFYYDHLVFALHLHAVLFLLATLLVPFAALVPGPWPGRLLLLAGALYPPLAMRRVYEQGWLAVLLKFVLVAALYLAIVATALGALLLMGVMKG